jgi:hypothetical protein
LQAAAFVSVLSFLKLEISYDSSNFQKSGATSGEADGEIMIAEN